MRHLHLSIARSSFIPFILTGGHSSPVYNLDLRSIHELQQVFLSFELHYFLVNPNT
ncbi:hypothetical protein [Acinetobacter ursingii]|uniref:hypothetical protein n=1 Tax=Acinetobacter ursingii TaxID=108980 RepID=UPI000A54B681